MKDNYGYMLTALFAVSIVPSTKSMVFDADTVIPSEAFEEVSRDDLKQGMQQTAEFVGKTTGQVTHMATEVWKEVRNEKALEYYKQEFLKLRDRNDLEKSVREACEEKLKAVEQQLASVKAENTRLDSSNQSLMRTNEIELESKQQAAELKKLKLSFEKTNNTLEKQRQAMHVLNHEKKELERKLIDGAALETTTQLELEEQKSLFAQAQCTYGEHVKKIEINARRQAQQIQEFQELVAQRNQEIQEYAKLHEQLKEQVRSNEQDKGGLCAKIEEKTEKISTLKQKISVLESNQKKLDQNLQASRQRVAEQENKLKKRLIESIEEIDQVALTLEEENNAQKINDQMDSEQVNEMCQVVRGVSEGTFQEAPIKTSEVKKNESMQEGVKNVFNSPAMVGLGAFAGTSFAMITLLTESGKKTLQVLLKKLEQHKLKIMGISSVLAIVAALDYYKIIDVPSVFANIVASSSQLNRSVDNQEEKY